MRLSEYEAGTILVDGEGKVFIHDGFINADGYGVIIGEDSDGMIQKSNGIGIETSFNCNTKNRTLMIGSGSTVVFTRKYIDCSSIQYIEVFERTK